MLFKENELASEYDFGQTVSDDNSSLKCLADEIYRVTQIIAETMVEKKLPVFFRHTDNHDETMSVHIHPSKGEDELFERSPEAIRQLLYRKGRSSTISAFLEKFDIKQPDERTPAYKEYLQVLYFFYMMRYFAFEDDSFFRMWAKTPTSELSPVEGASQGKYLWFILSNLMDDKKSCEIFIRQDIEYSNLISVITKGINRFISEDSFNENEERAQAVEQVLDRCNRLPPHEWSGGIILRVMNSVYQYQMLGYSGDMIRNLAEKERPFYFPELEIEAPLKSWHDRSLVYDQLEDFLKEKEVAVFCTQREDLPRPDKALRYGPTEILKYVFKEDLERGNNLFVQKNESGKVWISALIAAVIVRTYLDITDEKLLVEIKKKNGWDHYVSFKNALLSSHKASGSRLANDLAYRLFVVAFHSEYLNATKGPGYWPVLFRPIYLRNYIFVQRCVNCVFFGHNPNEWRDRLHYFIVNLP